MILDWNDTVVSPFRRGFNYDVPCYFMSFPPYREPLGPASCPISTSGIMSSFQQARERGFAADRPLLPCDSYLGLAIFVLAAVAMTLLVVTVFYLTLTSTQLVSKELKEGKFVESLEKLLLLRNRERTLFRENFSFPSRFVLEVTSEVARQARDQVRAIVWLFWAFVGIIKGLLEIAISPIVVVGGPLLFLGRTLVTITWLNTFTAEGKERLKQMEALRGKRKKVDAAGAQQKGGYGELPILIELCFTSPLRSGKVRSR